MLHRSDANARHFGELALRDNVWEASKASQKLCTGASSVELVLDENVPFFAGELDVGVDKGFEQL